MSRFWPAKTLSPLEHQTWANKVWRRIDRDMSGFITRSELDCEEFRSIMRSVLAPLGGDAAMGGAHYARAEMNMNQAINFCLRKADLNADTALSFNEFKSFTWCLRHDHLARDTASLIFALFDLDQDGLLSESEFREIWRFYLGHKPTEVDFQEEWGRLDSTARRHVTRAEYAQWLQASANPIFKQHAPEAPSEPELQKSSSSGRLPKLGKSGRQPRPLWNHRQDPANPGVRQHISLRTYFSRPQSLPELSRHYQTHRGFGKQHHRLLNHVEPEVKQVLSNERGHEFHPERNLPGGIMRSRSTGKLERWDHHWQTPLCMKAKIRPGTLNLRASEPPPRWMLEYKSDFELPGGGAASPSAAPAPWQTAPPDAWPSAPGGPPHGPGALLLVGPAGAGGGRLAEVLCASGLRPLGPSGAALGRRARPELDGPALVVDVPAADGGALGAAAAARLAALLEQCLLDEAVLGGVFGVVVACGAAARALDPSAAVVRALLQTGAAGEERWRSVLLCGTDPELLEPVMQEVFRAEVADAFFQSAPGPRGAALAAGPADPGPLFAAVQQLPGARISYRRPPACDLAAALAPALGVERDGLAAELRLAREEMAGGAKLLEAGLAGLVGLGDGRRVDPGDELAEIVPCAVMELSSHCLIA